MNYINKHPGRHKQTKGKTTIWEKNTYLFSLLNGNVHIELKHIEKKLN